MAAQPLLALRTSSRGRPARDLTSFLPTTREEMSARGWDELDVLIVTGDAYVDHPAFGPVLIARFLEGRGYRVGDRRAAALDRRRGHRAHGSPAPLRRRQRGQPRLDAQQADRAEEGALARTSTRRAAVPTRGPTAPRIVYANLCRQAFPGLPVVLGGIEASLRRIAHYDYWSDSGASLDPARRQGGPARLRHGRAAGVGDRAAPRRRRARSSSSPTSAARRTSARTAAAVGATSPRTRAAT